MEFLYVSKTYVGLENKLQQAQAPTSQHFFGCAAVLPFPPFHLSLSSLPFPSPFIFLSLFLPLPRLRLRVAGWRLSAPAGPGEPGRQTNFDAFEAEKVLLI